MRIKNVAAIVLFLASNFALAQHYKVLHSFSGPPNDASYVVSGLVQDKQGNLYGTSANGGTSAMGTVFKLVPNRDGSWTESIIYNFCSVFDGELCLDGSSSYAPLVFDSMGNLYGTTVAGGSQTACGGSCGTIFELSPPAGSGGTWTESVLYNLCSISVGGKCVDGESPQAPLIFDSAGNLYGTAYGGNGHALLGFGGGVVFQLSPGTNGWSEVVLYNFCSLGHGNICPDGHSPLSAGVTFDPAGELYGTTEGGGSTKNFGGGVVYKLSKGSDGWNESVLAAYPSPTQFYGMPSGGVSLDQIGNLYGSFEFPKGGVFRLNPKTLHKSVFAFNGADGEQPIGGVTLDQKHSVLYGTTSGASGGTADIYKIDATGKQIVLYKFCSQTNCTDGSLPWATLIQDSAGNLYGTTEFGGEFGNGVVFEYTP